MDPSDGDPAVEVAGARRALPGESACGDAWAHVPGRDGRALLALFDGLGHGEAAALAADMASEFLQAQASRDGNTFDLARLMPDLDQALRQTRGAVGLMAVIDPNRRLLQFVGVGNIEGYILGTRPVRLVPRFGMIGGGKLRHVRPQSIEFPPETMLILHTDGVTEGALSQIPRLRSCAGVAEFIMGEWARPHDDAAVVVARYPMRASGT